ncbi:MAG: hypothetical protein HYX75_17230 [Acidobacteria bacterium]|nr:hypothetical protein [Acidobacteriota bacterium]
MGAIPVMVSTVPDGWIAAVGSSTKWMRGSEAASDGAQQQQSGMHEPAQGSPAEPLSSSVMTIDAVGEPA